MTLENGTGHVEVAGSSKDLDGPNAVAKLVSENEDWLVKRILHYAKLQGYARYTSTLEEAWRLSIAGLSESLAAALGRKPSELELGPDDDFTQDAIAAFGMVEARKHRERGVNLAMFIGLMKYYRQSYIDLVLQAGNDGSRRDHGLRVIERFFDRIEIAFCTQWASLAQGDRLTELQAANRFMTNEKNKYLTIFESLPNPVILVDNRNRIENINRSAARLLRDTGVSGSQYHQLPVEVSSANAEPADRRPLGTVFPWLQAELNDFLETQQATLGYETSVSTMQGRKDYFVRLSRMLDVSGKFEGSLIILDDVSQSKQAALSLQESEERYRTLFDNATDAIYLTEPGSGRITQCNRKASEMTGYTVPALLQMTIYDLHPPDQVAKIAAEFDRLSSGLGISPNFSLQHRTADGSLIPVEVIISRIEIKNQAFHISMVRDIRDRQKAEEALRRQNAYMAALHETSLGMLKRLEVEELLQSIVEKASALTGIPDGFLHLYDPQQDVLEMRACCGDLSSVKGFQLRPGKGFAGSVWQQGRPLLIEDYRNWSQRDANPEFDALGSLVGAPLRSGNKIEGVIGLAHHDPDKKIDPEIVLILEQFAELAAIAIDNARLYSDVCNELKRRKVLEQEREKMEMQLIQSQKMEAIGTLAGGIAHDFNNLLMGMLGNASLMLSETKPGQPNYEELKSIESYVQKATHLTRQLLGFARGGKYEVKSVDINELIRQNLLMFGRTKKEILIDADLPENIWPVEVDPNQIDQALLNIYVNAWQAMPGGGRLFVKSENTTLDEKFVRPFGVRAGRFVKISITDSGIGMDEATRQRIFEPFFSTKQKRTGTGLGLASVYGIIKNHGGMIAVRSVPSHGATFEIYLPASGKPVRREIRPKAEKLTGTETILLIDDEDLIIQVGEKMLDHLGYRVLTCNNGEEGIELYRRHHRDIKLVILDMIMPELNGGEVFDRLRTIDPNATVLLSSGYSLEGQAAKIMKRGCNGFIQKPFTLEQLSKKIRDILKK